MWGLSAAALQAISSWSLALAGAAGVLAVVAGLVSAVASARLADLTRSHAAAEVAQARQSADAEHARADAARRTAQARAAALATANVRLEQVLERDAAPSGETGSQVFARRAEAFAALVRDRTAGLALVVGHGPGAHASGQIMRQALRTAGVPVRWCRLKASAEADHAAADTLTVYADPARPEASALIQALTAAGFAVEVAPFRSADPGVPSPAIVFAAARRAPAAAALSLCNPVVGAPMPPGD